jgi:hypothetical protein
MRSLRQVAEIHLGEIFAWFKVYAMEIRVKRLLGQITPQAIPPSRDIVKTIAAIRGA